MRKLFFAAILLVPTLVFGQVLPVVKTTNPITLSCVPSTVSGPPPLAVHFDCSQTFSSNIPLNDSFAKIEFNFNFGEPNSTPAGVCGESVVAGEGFWRCGKSHGTDSKNTQVGGGVATHVYETVGDHQACIFAKDGTSTSTTQCHKITVLDPEIYFSSPNGRTYCFSTSGNFTGCPSADGADHITLSNIETIMRTYLATNRRLLFRGGETWSHALNNGLELAFHGNTVNIGSYGTGKARILNTAGSSIIRVGNGTYNYEDNNGWSDIRIYDFILDGSYCKIVGTSIGSAFSGISDFHKFLSLRIDVVNMIGIYGPTLYASRPYDMFTVQDMVKTDCDAYTHFTLQSALTTNGITSFTVNEVIPATTNQTGNLKIKDNSGLYHSLNYTSWSGSTFSGITGADPNTGWWSTAAEAANFGTYNASAGNYVALSVSGSPFFVSGYRYSIMGNYVDGGNVGEYNFRAMHNNKMFVSHNTFKRPGNNKGILQIRGYDHRAPSTSRKDFGFPYKAITNQQWSEYTVVSDNEGSWTGSQLQIANYGMGNYTEDGTTYDYRVRKNVFERNYLHGFVASTSGMAAFTITAPHSVMRNNIVDSTGVNISNCYSGSWGSQNYGGTIRLGNNLYFYNNTCYSGTQNTVGMGLIRWFTQQNGEFKNNTLYCPNCTVGDIQTYAGGSLPTIGGSATGGTYGNVLNTQSISTTPFSGTPTMGNWSSYTNGCGSPYTAYPCNQGTQGAIYDGMGNLRTSTDSGAIQHIE